MSPPPAPPPPSPSIQRTTNRFGKARVSVFASQRFSVPGTENFEMSNYYRKKRKKEGSNRSIYLVILRQLPSPSLALSLPYFFFRS